MKWFKHDTDASIDAKLQELLLDYGASGYGLYWYCVELIAQNISDTNITFELEHDARIIARNLNLTVQETKDMMQKMIKLELFSISKNNKLACYALAKRLDQSMTSNSKFRNLISQIKTSSHDKVMIESEPPLDKVMQEEKRREEKRREEIRKEEKREEKEEISHTPFAEIVNYLNLKANTKYKSSSNKTKDLIKARFNEGFNFEDFKIVIDKKTTEWLKDKKMSIYLRPETLFSNKFEGYLNQVVAKSTLDLSGKTYDISRDDEEF